MKAARNIDFRPRILESFANLLEVCKAVKRWHNDLLSVVTTQRTVINDFRKALVPMIIGRVSHFKIFGSALRNYIVSFGIVALNFNTKKAGQGYRLCGGHGTTGAGGNSRIKPLLSGNHSSISEDNLNDVLGHLHKSQRVLPHLARESLNNLDFFFLLFLLSLIHDI